jgi:hypothetical protein
MSLSYAYSRLSWITVLVLAFLCNGVRIMIPEVMKGVSYAELEPYQSTDSALAILGVRHPQARLDEVIRTWPVNRDILYAAPNRSPFAMQVYYVLLSQVYPRHMAAILCVEGPNPSHIVIENGASMSKPIDDLMLFDIRPLPSPNGATHLGPNFTVAPHSGVANWSSFCPSSPSS